MLVFKTTDTLDKERAADLIVALNEAAAAHGFLLGIEVEQNWPNEMVGIRLRFIQTTDSSLPAPDQESARRQAVAELEKPPLRSLTPLGQVLAGAKRLSEAADALAAFAQTKPDFTAVKKPPIPTKGLERG